LWSTSRPDDSPSVEVGRKPAVDEGHLRLLAAHDELRAPRAARSSLRACVPCDVRCPMGWRKCRLCASAALWTPVAARSLRGRDASVLTTLDSPRTITRSPRGECCSSTNARATRGPIAWAADSSLVRCRVPQRGTRDTPRHGTPTLGRRSGRSQPGDEVARLPLVDLLAVDGARTSWRLHRRCVGGGADIDGGEAGLVDEVEDDSLGLLVVAA
jgi:hypothetical protein